MKNINDYINESEINEGLLDKSKEIFGKLKNIINKKFKSLSKEDEEVLNDFFWAIDTSELDNDIKKELLNICKGKQ